MPKHKRHKTKYPGVYYIEGTSGANGKSEKIYYIIYRRGGKLIEEKAGRQLQDDMSPARASRIRSLRISGDQLSNREQRQAQKRSKQQQKNHWTIARLWEEYRASKPFLKSIRSDDCIFKKHLEPVFGNKEPEEIDPLEIDHFRNKISKSKSPQTVKYLLALLKRTVNFGVRKQLCQGLGFKIEMPKVNNQKTEDLTPEQLKGLLEAIEQDSNIQAANLMKMALFTGMRRGELFRLKWDDIDSERGFILIRDPKGGVDQKIPLNAAARELLEQHTKTDSPFIFPGRGGRQRTDIKKQVNRIKERAGLPIDFRALHGLRHVYASMLASSGRVDLYTLQKLLTHKSPQMTQRYAHLRDETLKRASNVAAEILSKVLKENQANKVVSLDKAKK